MNKFGIPRIKLIELLVFAVINLILWFIFSDLNFLVLYSLGFIWNWVASYNMDSFFEMKRYRFSMLKLVFNLQNLFLKPFKNKNSFLLKLVKILPIGSLWLLVMYFNESNIPWWSVFLGSATYELMSIEIDYILKARGNLQ